MTTTGRQPPAPPHVARAPRPAASWQTRSAARARARRRARRRRGWFLGGTGLVLVLALAAALVVRHGHDAAPQARSTVAAESAPLPATAPEPTARDLAAAAITTAWADRWRGADGFLGTAKGPASCTGSDDAPGRCTQEYAGGTLVWQPASGTPTSAADGTVSVADVDDPASDLVVVNKQRPLDPEDWAPAKLVQVGGASQVLRPEAASALGKLFAAAAKAGHPLTVHSAYRSYPVQQSTYEGWVGEFGKKKADAESARAGYSEHQTGLALDVLARGGSCQAMACFGSTAQSRWLAANAWRYGFVVRYPDGATKVTGYEYEPWHVRYVGVAVASDMHRQGIATLETYFGLAAAPDY